METDARFFIGVKALIKNRKGMFLLLEARSPALKSTKRKAQFWDLPGGKIWIGENDVKKTLEREVSEELGVKKGDLKVGKLFDASVSNLKIQHGKRIPLFLVTFECALKGNAFILTEEHERFAWVPKRRAAKLLGIKFNKAFVSKLKKAV